MDSRTASQGLLQFICESPCAFFTVKALRARLDKAGFAYLPEGTSWTQAKGLTITNPAWFSRIRSGSLTVNVWNFFPAEWKKWPTRIGSTKATPIDIAVPAIVSSVIMRRSIFFSFALSVSRTIEGT